MIGGVSYNIDLSTEAEVLLVIRQEIELDTTVRTHIDRIGDVIPVELDGITTDGRTELMTHQQDIVVVDINVGKCLAHHRRQDLTRLEQVVHPT